MKKEIKMKIIFLLFMVIIIGIGFFLEKSQVKAINWPYISEFFSQNNSFWEIISYGFMVSLGVVIVVGVPSYGALMLFDIIPILGFEILKNKFEKIEYVFDDYLEASITTLVVDGWIEGNAFIAFLKILGAKVLFFILTPFLVLFWIIKWVSYGLFRLTKLAV